MLPKLRSALACLLLLTLICVTGPAQARKVAPSAVASNSMRLSQLRVLGSKRFESETLAKVLAMQIGKSITEDDMKAAADRLASTGVFSEVTYSYVSSPSGTRLEFKVNDADTFYPAHFDNFVWLSREELLRAVQQRDPLFVGEVPAAGEMYSQVAAHLKALLEERNLKADVTVMPEAPQGGGKILGFLYKVEGVKIPIRNFEVPGATPEIATLLQNALAPQVGSDYSFSRMRALARLDLMPVYLTRGYLHASFSEPQFALVDHATNAVTVTIPVEQGSQYILDSVQWSGNTAYPAQELAKVLKVAIGKPANVLQLEDDLGGITKIYGTKGYLRVHCKPTPTFDETSKKVAFTISINEGDQFKMGAVRFEGIASSLESQIRPFWKLQPGATFDTSYTQMFVDTLARNLDVRSVRINTRQNVHEDTKTVDLTVRFELRQ